MEEVQFSTMKFSMMMVKEEPTIVSSLFLQALQLPRIFKEETTIELGIELKTLMVGVLTVTLVILKQQQSLQNHRLPSMLALILLL